ncbi:MAG: hypothetical protein LBH10_02865 [Burkholderiaceae bacterium]|nr:hypothetical protein [Burkholderiaceae bacterium]
MDVDADAGAAVVPRGILAAAEAAQPCAATPKIMAAASKVCCILTDVSFIATDSSKIFGYFGGKYLKYSHVSTADKTGNFRLKT